MIPKSGNRLSDKIVLNEIAGRYNAHHSDKAGATRCQAKEV